MNEIIDMQIWTRAVDMAVSLYQVKGTKIADGKADEEFGHFFSASLNTVYKDYMIVDIDQLTFEQAEAIFFEPEN